VLRPRGDTIGLGTGAARYALPPKAKIRNTNAVENLFDAITIIFQWRLGYTQLLGRFRGSG